MRRMNHTTESSEDRSEEGRREWTWIVDSVSEGVVRVEQDGKIFHVPRWLCPASTREGDVLRVSASPSDPETLEARIVVDADATEEIRRDVEERIQRLQSTDPGGDLQL